MKKLYILSVLSFFSILAVNMASAQGTFQRIILTSLGGDAYAVRQTSDGGYIVAGSAQSAGFNGWEACMVKLNNQGDTVWSRTYGGPDKDYGYNVMQTADPPANDAIRHAIASEIKFSCQKRAFLGTWRRAALHHAEYT